MLHRNMTTLAFLLLGGCVDNLSHDAPLPEYTGVEAALTCVPDLDGRITAQELQPAFGIPASYRISPAGTTRAVDLGGHVDDAGQRIWDFSAHQPDDQLTHLTATPLKNQWYAGQFAGGQFTVPFDASGRIDAVYRQDAEALWLLGIASHDPAPPEGKTLLPYEQPVAALRFPLQVGAHWTSLGKTRAGAGVLHGIPFASQDAYDVTVDAAGRLELPDLALTQALRVRTSVSVAPVAGIPTQRKQVSFVFECLGEVARVVSQDGEKITDFTVASEVRRLAL
jgi:hypothetical protein